MKLDVEIYIFNKNPQWVDFAFFFYLALQNISTVLSWLTYLHGFIICILMGAYNAISLWMLHVHLGLPRSSMPVNYSSFGWWAITSSDLKFWMTLRHGDSTEIVLNSPWTNIWDWNNYVKLCVFRQWNTKYTLRDKNCKNSSSVLFSKP